MALSIGELPQGRRFGAFEVAGDEEL